MKMKVKSAFLTAKDVQDGDLITFLDEGEEVEGKFGLKYVITVETPMNEEKKLSLNNRSVRNITEHYGEDSKEWVGKQARVNLIRIQVGKEFKVVIFLTAPNKDIDGNVIAQ